VGEPGISRIRESDLNTVESKRVLWTIKWFLCGTLGRVRLDSYIQEYFNPLIVVWISNALRKYHAAHTFLSLYW